MCNMVKKTDYFLAVVASYWHLGQLLIRVSNSDIKFQNSEIEFQYRFRNSKSVNSDIFEYPKFAKFG